MREEKNKRFKRIAYLEHNNQTYTDTNEIQEVLKMYYQDLYGEIPFNESEASKHLATHIKSKISRNDAQQMISEIANEEVWAEICRKSLNKSPGPDGLTVEFYRRYWETIGGELTAVINEVNNGKDIPIGFKEDIIVLIPKVTAPKRSNDFRPISLLNTDYKLFMSCMRNRISGCLETIIGRSQTCSVPGRTIFDSLIHLREEVVTTYMSNHEKLILNLDFDHAFDRTSHKYLWWVLTKYGFPARFVENIKSLYSGSQSKLNFNGNLSKRIEIKSSVRQGCPLSMALFII